ncbi:hypothetical protein HU200_021612 [Digitaria exilis]|uniref:Uncharacterized protein n=1 Tax=Digitaria exilis TaxID=1010633 RepID=A0A835EZH0_9POAL|nr:hypothetical protein HU200_021612 [Digitaria exilis]
MAGRLQLPAAAVTVLFLWFFNCEFTIIWVSNIFNLLAAPEKEWGLIYKLASDKQGFLHKDSVRGIYDGSVFYKLEEQRTSSRSDI